MSTELTQDERAALKQAQPSLTGTSLVVEGIIAARMAAAWQEGADSRCPDIDRCWCEPSHDMRNYPPTNPYRAR